MKKFLAALALIAASNALTAFAAGSLDVEAYFDGVSDSGYLAPGVDYTNLHVSGWVKVSNANAPSVTAGLVRIHMDDSHGASVLIADLDWNGSASALPFDVTLNDLTAGVFYTVGVKVVPDAEHADEILGEADSEVYCFTGRHNDLYWFDENGATAEGSLPGYGVWTTVSGYRLAATEEGAIGLVNASVGGDYDAYASFAPTNFAAVNAGVTVTRMKTAFDRVTYLPLLPDVEGRLFGLALAGTNEEAEPFLMIVRNGEWERVPRETFAPSVGVEYDFEIFCTEATGSKSVGYYVYDLSGERVQLAACPRSDYIVDRPSELDFYGTGEVSVFRGEVYDTSLLRATVKLDGDDSHVMAGANFTNVWVKGVVTVSNLWATTLSDVTVRVTVRDRDGAEVGTYEGTFNGETSLDFTIPGLEPGTYYSASVEVVNDSHSVDGDMEQDFRVPTARQYSGRWIDEDADTFDGARDASGDWLYAKTPSVEAATVDDSELGRVIHIDTGLDSSVIFDPADNGDEVASSTMREIRFELRADAPSYYLSDPQYAQNASADLAGVAIACDDTDGCRCCFSVYSPDNGGEWKVLYDAPAELGELYKVVVVLTYPNPNKTSASSIDYYLENSDGSRDALASVTPASGMPTVSGSYRSRLRFAGDGVIKSLYGDCYDAHLASVDGVEYWTIQDAIAEIGSSGRVLTPLWYGEYEIEASEGYFGVIDDHVPPYLNLIWPLGYVVEITESGEARYYLFRIGDYWTDWAENGEDDLIETETGWKVLSANGLAWLARESTNSWITGDITLAANLTNLAEHIWTPIQGFEGVFDGGSKTIAGLTNKSWNEGDTNSLDMTAYGLFATASNSVFRNVVFVDVAITNDSDAVAALLGCAIGDLAVSNVVVRSGELVGGGSFISGIVGYVAGFEDVSISGNLNASTIVGTADGGSTVSGVANLGGNGAVLGSIVIADNENRGTIATTVVSADNGGNIAQVVAGTDGDAQFDASALTITGNVGTGDVSRVTIENHEGSAIAQLPVVNLAPVVSRQSDGEDYREYIEANDSTDVLIDPYLKTARMTGAFYQDGAVNYAGRVNDQITATPAGGLVTLQDSILAWSPIVLDRPITLDLNGRIVDNVFDNYAFEVGDFDGVATVKDGTVTYKEGMLANKAVGDGWTMTGVTEVPWTVDYWDRTLYVDGEFMAVAVPEIEQLVAEGVKLQLPEDSPYTIDARTSTLRLGGRQVLSFATLGYQIDTVVEDGTATYVVTIDDDPVTSPEINLSIVPNEDVSIITVKGAKAKCEYCLQSIATLSESWDKADDEWVSVANDGDTLEFRVERQGPSGFYRIKVRAK